MSDAPRDYTLAENLQTVLSNTLKQPHWNTASDHLVSAPTHAEALAVPEIKALMDAAKDLDDFMRGHGGYERSGYGPKLRAALAQIKGGRRMACNHKRGDWIKENGYWLCADCWVRLEKRPTKYTTATPVRGTDGKWTCPQPEISWQAEIAQADGLTLNDFLRAMACRFMCKTHPPMVRDDAYDAAIDALKNLGDPYGDTAYSWDAEGAREFADEMRHWDHAERDA